MPKNTSPSEKVLVVDDDSQFCKLLEKKLKAKNYIVETVLNGSEALYQIYLFAPNIVLLDISMPGLEGNELVATIKAFRPEIDIFMITGLKNQKIKEQCIQKGALACFDKSVNFDDLAGEIKKALQKRKNIPPIYKTPTEEELQEVGLVFKLLEKKKLMTREEMLIELQKIKSRKG